MKIRKGDKVKVIAGKDKGREGVVDKIYNNSERLLIQGVNMYKRHIKKNEQMPQGGIVDLPRALAISKVMVICAKCNKPVRVGYVIKDNKKMRVCKNCNNKI